MNYYKRHLGDYAKKTGRLSILQHGVYNLLIDACYDREKFPTREEAIEWTWASTQQEIEAVDFVLARFFDQQIDCTFIQQRIKDEITDYHAKSATNKRIALERESNRARTVDDASPNHKPLTTNQEPKTPTVSTSAKPKARGKPSKKVPEHFVVSDSLKSWASESAPLVDWRKETEKFMDWEFKHARSDWDATWRTWMRNAQQSLEEKGFTPSRRDEVIV